MWARFNVLKGPFRGGHTSFSHYSPADECHKVAETVLHLCLFVVYSVRIKVLFMKDDNTILQKEFGG